MMAQTQVAVDDILLQQAQEVLGGKSDSETVEVALMEVLRMKKPAEMEETSSFEVREPSSCGSRVDRESLPVYSDLDFLIGSWSEDEAREFAEATEDFERIDPALWR